MDAYLGEIRMFGGDFAPVDWAMCDGSLISILGNEALFGLIGRIYGGDGASHFALPDLRGRFPTGQGAGPRLPGGMLGQQPVAELAPAEPSGGGDHAEHANTMPSLAVSFIICMQGLLPQQL